MVGLISFIILIFSVIIHEIAHGYVADLLGDPTARLQGRLTLNPLKHIDPIGSILVPIVTTLSGFTFGWAKPVIYNPYNLKNKRRGEILIALAGPASNILLALIFSLLIRLIVPSNALELSPFTAVLSLIVLTNLVLAIFNLIPVPPLDGSKLFLALLPKQYGKIRRSLEILGPILIFVVAFVLWDFISPLVPMVFRILTGISLT